MTIVQKYFIRTVSLYIAVTAGISAVTLKEIERCHNTAKSTHDFRRCNQIAYAYHDKRLNTAYKKLMHALPKEEQTRLKKAQRAWIKFRDTECDLEGYEMRGGSFEYVLIGGCLARLTKERANVLEKFTP